MSNKKISFVSSKKKSDLVQTKGTNFKTKLAKLMKAAISNKQRRHIYKICVKAGVEVPAEIMAHFRPGWASVNPIKAKKPYSPKVASKVTPNPVRQLRRMYDKSMGCRYTGVTEQGCWLYPGGVSLSSAPINIRIN